MLTATIISPDIASAKPFSKIIKSYDIDVKILPVKIHPRVEKNKFTHNISLVSDDLESAFEQAFKQHTNIVTIACNTLSLPIFINPVLNRLENKYGHKIYEIIYLTTKSILNYVNSTNKKSIILGTKPLMNVLPLNNIHINSNLINTNKINEKYLNLIQEIIWRVKAIQESDVSTAPQYFIKLKNKTELKNKIDKLFNFLTSLQIEEVIMGCTELPYSFEIMKTNHKLNFKLIDPAELVAQDILLNSD